MGIGSLLTRLRLLYRRVGGSLTISIITVHSCKFCFSGVLLLISN